MTPNDRHTVPASDNESLSALFDGELRGDAARFALKRLGHDASWQEACGRWQMIGDALRGQSTSAASGDLAQRIAAALVDEPTPVLLAPAPMRRTQGSRWLRRGWAGGALAASVAAVLFVARPLQQADAPTPDVAPAASQVVSVAPAQPLAPVAEQPVPASRELASAVEPAPARQPVRQGAAARLRATRATARLAAEAARVAPGPQQPALVATQAVDPFRMPTHGEIVTRPWPRAVLPGSAAAGALTASFATPAEAPSFYPFEPQLPPSHLQGAPSAPQP